MEVVAPFQDFRFDSPYASAPSSPKSAGDDAFSLFRRYTSAPTSPTREYSSSPPDAAVAVPEGDDEDAVEFAFEFSGHLDKQGLPVLTADELFKEGKIRPLNPPPRQESPSGDDRSKVASSLRRKWSPGRRGRGRAGEEFDDDRFAEATVEPARDGWKEKTSALFSFSSSRGQKKASRSLSPLRGGGSFFRPAPSHPEITTILKNGDGDGSKKSRLKNILLFHSASEGRVTGNQSKDLLRKYTLLSSASNSKVDAKDLKNSSFRSTENSGSGGFTRRGSGGMASSHEKHYAANRAASEDLKKKTALPYRQSLLGCLGFTPAVLSFSRGFHGKSFSRR